MNEVEVLVMIKENDLEKVHREIAGLAQLRDSKKVVDIYYYDELRKQLKPDENMAIYECFRLREKEDKAYLTYKIDRFNENGKWIYSDEHETEISNGEEVKKIIENLGLKQLVVVDMVKTFYENADFIFTVEVVKDLGVFLEVESKKELETTQQIEKERRRIETIISNIKVETSPDLGIGKPELLLKKKYRRG